MTTDRNANRTDGETHGSEQEPVEAGERDTTQQRQHQREGSPPPRDPSQPDADAEDALATSPDQRYGRSEGQAGTPDAGMPLPGGESQGAGAPFTPRGEDRD
ncbi:MAG TPA: hypothetical protein VFH63_05155 [candidate division Zixibacteria bacterium]|nr:hypothetical protein [candidate division Zixibacteria bacterium]